jgi:hypothetical protein
MVAWRLVDEGVHLRHHLQGVAPHPGDDVCLCDVQSGVPFERGECLQWARETGHDDASVETGCWQIAFTESPLLSAREHDRSRAVVEGAGQMVGVCQRPCEGADRAVVVPDGQDDHRGRTLFSHLHSA